MMRITTLFIVSLFATLLHGQVYLEWAKSMGGEFYDKPSAMALGVGGIVHTTGRFQTTADFDPSNGTQNLTTENSYGIFISKLANDGSFIWARELEGTSFQYAQDIAVDVDGNVYVLGTFEDSLDVDPGPGVQWLFSAAGNVTAYWVKLDAAGNLDWAFQLGGQNASDFCYPAAIDLSPDGSVHVSGTYYGTIDFDPGPGSAELITQVQHGFLLKVASNEAFLWVREFVTLDGSLTISEIGVDNDSNVLLTGSFSGNVDFDPGPGQELATANDVDILLVKLDATGGLVWYRVIGGDDGGRRQFCGHRCGWQCSHHRSILWRG